MSKLDDIIKAEIALQGAIPFTRFMELALYCPEYGFYERESDTVGRGGDFYTSVSVGSLFGELLAFQFAGWLAQLDQDRPQLVEAGAHDGRLAADILRWLRQWRPKLFERTEYIISEFSDQRRGWQRETLKEFAGQVRWLESDLRPQADGFSGVIFANELLDAMPVHRLGWDAQRREWFEWGVVAVGEQFRWFRMEPSKVLNPESASFRRLADLPGELLGVLPDGFTTELSPEAENWWHHAAVGLRRGWLVTLDYGFESEEFFAPHRSMGTLRAFRRHRLCEAVLANPGEQDLTAHVNFSGIQQAGESAGLKTELFTTQADFFARIMKEFWPETESQGAWTSARSREFRTLVHPEHLGRAFRVLVQSR
jgi:SAM-dependent MidA family methyltransferase